MKEKQIDKQAVEEMAKVLEEAKINAQATIGSMNGGFGMWYAEALYRAGYCKQSVGEWIISSDGYYPYCSECKNEPKNGVMTDYCPNCGAKMKGGGEE